MVVRKTIEVSAWLAFFSAVAIAAWAFWPEPMPFATVHAARAHLEHDAAEREWNLVWNLEVERHLECDEIRETVELRRLNENLVRNAVSGTRPPRSVIGVGAQAIWVPFALPAPLRNGAWYEASLTAQCFRCAKIEGGAQSCVQSGGTIHIAANVQALCPECGLDVKPEE